MGSSSKLAIPWRGSSRRRRNLTRYIVALILILITIYNYGGLFLPSIQRTKIQYDFEKRFASRIQSARLAAVKHEFMHAWSGYKHRAWMADAILPLIGARSNQFCGWSATLIDSLDTLWIMDLEGEFDEAIEAVLTIDFAQNAASCEVNVFESTIRYLGGLLAAYDLSQDSRLLPKLKELGDILNSAFKTSTGMPCGRCISAATRSDAVPPTAIPLADLGSFYLEFGRLWQITNDEKYLKTLNFLTELFERNQQKSSIPGLWPQWLNTTSLNETDAHFATSFHHYSLGAQSDSAYEYLVKAHLMFGGITSQYAKMWESAVNPLLSLMVFRAQLPPESRKISDDILFSGIISRKPENISVFLDPRTEHLACFAGGLFALSGRVFHRPYDLKAGAALTNGCVWAYNATVTGIMPETFGLLGCDNVDSDQQCPWNKTAFNLERASTPYCAYDGCRTLPDGFLSSIDKHYALRPEAIESVFVLYRITGDENWRDKGWTMFQHIIEHTRTRFGHATIEDTTKLSLQPMIVNGEKVMVNATMHRDEMESFWLAETLKYFWLLFSDPDLLSLDEWVFNTEAHPLRLVEGQRAVF